MEHITNMHRHWRGRSSSGKHVTILGSGVAGLVAARELEREGYAVDIMEGAGRIGGRVWTHRFGNGPDAPYGELGAMRIPDSHEHVLRLVRELGLGDRLRKFVTLFEEKNAFVHLGGSRYRICDAHKVVCKCIRELDLEADYSERTLAFAGWIHLIVDAISPQSLRESLKRDLQSHLLDELERLDLGAYFSADSQTVDLHAFFAEHPDFHGRLSDSLALFLDDILTETRSDLWQIEGGMDCLPNRLRETLRGPVTLNQEIVGLKACTDGVHVTWREGGRLYHRRCECALCTIPFSIVRGMKLEGFDQDKRSIIAEMEYCDATKVLFHCTRPFWTEVGISGGASFSDDHVRQVYYPSTGLSGPDRVLLGSYTIGSDAACLETMTEAARVMAVRDGLTRLHPEMAEPDMLLGATSMAWGSHKWSRGGCSVPWRQSAGRPRSQSEGQAERRRVLERQRYRALRPQGRLYFAGEHCSETPAWIEGAITSAMNAVGMITGRHPVGSNHDGGIVAHECT